MKRARPPVYVDITYEELGEYVGSKGIVQVSKKWLDSITGITQSKKGCSKCKQLLPLDAFNNDKRRQFGKRSQCRSCYKGNTIKVSRLVQKEESKIEYKLINLNE